MEAGRSRLRPIMMAGFTTIFAMTPIAFFPGAGTQTIQPIGLTFVSGLSVSFFMTLFVTPVMYSVVNARSEKKKMRKAELSMREEELVLGETQQVIAR
jgi:HAE1 family hydrophobic/amphiphilic exporter-1